jgi:hypothetical protein
MEKFRILLLLCIPTMGLCSDDNPSELYLCSFTAHTPVGNLKGRCTTQSMPSPDFVARWALTLAFDPQSAPAGAKIQPDSFYDIVRGQCLEDGRFTQIMPLWGDFVIKPEAPDYVEGLRACAPLFQVAPNKITLGMISTNPLVVQFLYEERSTDVDRETGTPSAEWMTYYWDSFRRLQQNIR